MYLNVEPRDVVSRNRDPQPQVVENDLYLSNLIRNIYNFLTFKQSFHSQ